MIPLTATQVAQGFPATFVRPLQEQPSHRSILLGNENICDKAKFIQFSRPNDCTLKVKLQYPVGSVVTYEVGRKRGKHGMTDIEIADATVISIHVCRVQEVTMGEVREICYDQVVSPADVGITFSKHFNSQFAKPRLRVVDGKKQYVAWVWDWENWVELYSSDSRLTRGYEGKIYWKRIPLTVYCNPFVEVVTLNTEEN